MERIITLLACSPLDAEHVGVLKAKHRAEREMLRQPGGPDWRIQGVPLGGLVDESWMIKDDDG